MGDKTRRQPRSSITGRFVSWWFAIRHPRTTVIEKIRRKTAAGDSDEASSG